MSELYKVTYSNSLAHHGIKGQKWGVRRFQNEDGTRTEAGKKRYRKNKVVLDSKEKRSVEDSILNKHRNKLLDIAKKYVDIENDAEKLDINDDRQRNELAKKEDEYYEYVAKYLNSIPEAKEWSLSYRDDGMMANVMFLYNDNPKNGAFKISVTKDDVATVDRYTIDEDGWFDEDYGEDSWRRIEPRLKHSEDMNGYSSEYLIHKQSHASYPGGFIKKNGRMNNSPAYNHAYYDDNKEKWPEYPSQQYKPMGNGKPSNIPSKADKKTGSSTSTSNANSNKPALSPLQQKARDEKLKYQNALKEKNLKDKAAKEAAAKAEAEKKAKQAATAASGSGKKGSSGGKGKGKSSSKTSEEKTTDSAKKEKTSKKAEKAKKEKSAKDKTKSADNSNTTAKLAEKKDPIDEDETLSEREKKMYKGIQNVAEKSGQSIATYLQNENIDSIISQYFPGEIDPDEKKVIKKKLMERYKLEHCEASIGEYYAVTYSDELSHFGVKGMKWGVRHDKEKTGKRRKKKESRYWRGSRYSEEREKRRKELDAKLRKNSPKYQKLVKENERLIEKYGLDADDGGGGDTERYSEKQLEAAGKKYWDNAVTIDLFEDEFKKYSNLGADLSITDKYGNTAISDIEYYDSVNAMVGLGAIALAAGGIAFVREMSRGW